jgi:hypothetical protein
MDRENASRHSAVDRAEIADLVRFEGHRIRGALLRLYPWLGNEWEDVLIEVICQLLEGKAKYDPARGSLRAYVLMRCRDTVAVCSRNRSRQTLLRKRTTGHSGANKESGVALSSSHVSPAAGTESAEPSKQTSRQAFFEKWVQQLSDEDRRLLLASVRDDVPHWAEQYAKEDGRSAGAIRVSAFRLRRRFERDYNASLSRNGKPSVPDPPRSPPAARPTTGQGNESAEVRP